MIWKRTGAFAGTGWEEEEEEPFWVAGETQLRMKNLDVRDSAVREREKYKAFGEWSFSFIARLGKTPSVNLPTNSTLHTSSSVHFIPRID
jgi:hypothetical protein